MSDEKLIRLIQTNPEKGIRKAMQLYGKAINTICQSVLQGCEDGVVDEAVSEVFFKLWKNSQQFSLKTGNSLKSWLYAIARNTAIDLRRKNGYSLTSLDDEGVQEPVSHVLVENEVEKKELKQMLYDVIMELGEPDSQVFLLKYFLAMKNKEISERLQISEKKTENILYRGKVKLKKMLIERGITCYED